MRGIALRLLQAVMLLVATTGCITAPMLRTARLLEPGRTEVSLGPVGVEGAVVSACLIAARGVTRHFEISAEAQDNALSIIPRVQLLRAEDHLVDLAAFFEVGYNGEAGLEWGPGAVIGRRWCKWEPYLSYQYRHVRPLNSDQADEAWLHDVLFDSRNYQYLKLGSRYFFKNPSDVETRSNWFLSAEAGVTFISARNWYIEWAACLGCQF